MNGIFTPPDIQRAYKNVSKYTSYPFHSMYVEFNGNAGVYVAQLTSVLYVVVFRRPPIYRYSLHAKVLCHACSKVKLKALLTYCLSVVCVRVCGFLWVKDLQVLKNQTF